MMNDRTSQILEAAIQEFIDTGEPVSSGWLYRKYDFGIKPAMIRLELDALEENGYLGQPYHSAGRVPTDHGYEFYVERVLGAMPARREAAEAHARARRATQNALAQLFEQRAWLNLLHELSSELGLLGVVADPMNDAVYKAGLEALINNFDWQDREEIRSVIRDFESVDERLSHIVEKIGNAAEAGPRVFIGKKSPVTRSENLSVVCSAYQAGDAMISIFAVGPKRMDYKKAINLFKNL